MVFVRFEHIVCFCGFGLCLDIALVFADPMHQLLYHRFARFLLFSKMTREGDAEEGVPLPPQPSVMLMLMQVLLGFAAYCIQYVASYMSFVYKFRLNAIM